MLHLKEDESRSLNVNDNKPVVLRTKIRQLDLRVTLQRIWDFYRTVRSGKWGGVGLQCHRSEIAAALRAHFYAYNRSRSVLMNLFVANCS